MIKCSGLCSNLHLRLTLRADRSNSTNHHLLQCVVILVPPLLQLDQTPSCKPSIPIAIHRVDFPHVGLVVHQPPLLIGMPLIIAHILAMYTLEVLLQSGTSLFVQADALLACLDSNASFVLRIDCLAVEVEESGRRDDGFENCVETSVGECAWAEVKIS
jgi:hypothetical protein